MYPLSLLYTCDGEMDILGVLPLEGALLVVLDGDIEPCPARTVVSGEGVDLPIARYHHGEGIAPLILPCSTVTLPYSPSLLEKALEMNETVRSVPNTGEYSGIPVVVTTIKNEDGYGIAAVGVVDVVGTIDLGTAFGDYPKIVNQVSDILKSRVIVP